MNAFIVAMTNWYAIIGPSCGSVMLVNIFHLPASSILAAWYSWGSMPCSPARNMTILKASADHTPKMHSVGIAQSGSVSQFMASIPKTARNLLKTPNSLWNMKRKARPIAIAFVTYGRKYAVWKNLDPLIPLFSSIAIARAIMIETGTVTMA